LNLIRVMPAKGQDISMQTSLVIARLIGPLFLTIGTGMLANTDTYRAIGAQFLGSYAIIYLSGIMILTGGLAILNAHPHWSRDWRSAITAIGWIFTIAGVWRLIAPQFVPFVGGAILDNRNFFVGAGIVLVAIGAFISFKGYMPEADLAHTETHNEQARHHR
jgi:hypothetical protein